MSIGDFVVVKVVSSEAEAQVVMSLLESRNIEAMLLEDDAGDQLPSLEFARGVKILVAARDEKRALEILAETEEGAG